MFTADPSYWHAVLVTVKFAVIATPLKLAAALGVALLLNRERRGTGLFRALFYLPSLLGGSVALAIVWTQHVQPRRGVQRRSWRSSASPAGPWVNDPDWALETLMVLAIWQFGAPMVIFLAGLKQVPTELYEAAAVDGAGPIRQFFKITLPMLSPVIFFNLVLETIHGFQGFTAAFVLSNGTGGPVDSTLMYTLYLYIAGFGELRDGLRLGDGLGVPDRGRADHRGAVQHRPVLGALQPTRTSDEALVPLGAHRSAHRAAGRRAVPAGLDGRHVVQAAGRDRQQRLGDPARRSPRATTRTAGRTSTSASAGSSSTARSSPGS